MIKKIKKMIPLNNNLSGYTLSDSSHVLGKEQERTEVLVFGFWTFLMSDFILFGLMFATYVAMLKNTAMGPGPKDVFDLTSVFIQTMALLFSSITFGIATLGMRYQQKISRIITWLIITLCLGATFLFFEVSDFISMFSQNAGPSRSGFLSAFFGLVPLHGLHVTVGSLWLIVMIIQILVFGMVPMVQSRLLRLGIFWHFLDIVWVGIFSIVYLAGLL